MAFYENMSDRVADSAAPGIQEAAAAFDAILLALTSGENDLRYDPVTVAQVERQAQVAFSAWAMAAAIGAEVSTHESLARELTAQLPDGRKPARQVRLAPKPERWEAHFHRVPGDPPREPSVLDAQMAEERDASLARRREWEAAHVDEAGNAELKKQLDEARMGTQPSWMGTLQRGVAGRSSQGRGTGVNG